MTMPTFLLLAGAAFAADKPCAPPAPLKLEAARAPVGAGRDVKLTLEVLKEWDETFKEALTDAAARTGETMKLAGASRCAETRAAFDRAQKAWASAYAERRSALLAKAAADEKRKAAGEADRTGEAAVCPRPDEPQQVAPPALDAGATRAPDAWFPAQDRFHASQAGLYESANRILELLSDGACDGVLAAYKDARDAQYKAFKGWRDEAFAKAKRKEGGAAAEKKVE